MSAMDLTVEEWRAVEGFDGYDVSNLGRVRSWRKGGTRPSRLDAPRVLKPWPNKNGYLAVYLCQGGGEKTVRKVYHLVLEAFGFPRPDGHEAAHADNNRSNNALSNLSWKTHLDNEQDKFVHGTTTRGERNGSRKLSREQVQDVLTSSDSCTVTAKRVGVCFQQVSRIRRRERWAHESHSAAPG